MGAGRVLRPGPPEAPDRSGDGLPLWIRVATSSPVTGALAVAVCYLIVWFGELTGYGQY